MAILIFTLWDIHARHTPRCQDYLSCVVGLPHSMCHFTEEKSLEKQRGKPVTEILLSLDRTAVL